MSQRGINHCIIFSLLPLCPSLSMKTLYSNLLLLVSFGHAESWVLPSARLRQVKSITTT